MSEHTRMIPFSPPDISEAEINEVAAALRSGWITTGPRTKKLEKEIAEWIGTEKCVCLNSQTACAEMALHILGVGKGDEVIVPAYTYTASASVIDHVGAKIVMIDSQKNSLEMEYDAVEAAVTERTKGIIPVDLGGVPCDYDRIFEIIERKKICSDHQMRFRKRSAELPYAPIQPMPSEQNGMGRWSAALQTFRVSVSMRLKTLRQLRAVR